MFSSLALPIPNQDGEEVFQQLKLYLDVHNYQGLINKPARSYETFFLLCTVQIHHITYKDLPQTHIVR